MTDTREKPCAQCGNVYYRGSHHSEKSWSVSRFCSRACQYIGKALKGKYTQELCAQWRGDDASYSAKHIWLKKNYGKANKCEECGVLNAKRYEWANISKTYIRDISDWRQLCASCHRLFDAKAECRHGHPRTEDNIYRPPSKPTHRYCRECARTRQNKYTNKKNGLTNNN